MAEIVEDNISYQSDDEDLEDDKVLEEETVEGTYAGLSSTGFRDFHLKPELLKAVKQCGFEHPSKVQQECIPQAILGTDVICQAKSGMGKTAVFVLSILHQLSPADNGKVTCVVICHTRELAYQIKKEVDRFSQFFDPSPGCEVFFGGVPFSQNADILRNNCPQIVVGTPGRLTHLMEERELNLGNVKFLVVDECDKVLDKDDRSVEKGGDGLDMRRKVQGIHMKCPKNKQVLMFTATLSAETKKVCKKFMNAPLEVCVDSDSKLKLRGLKQYHVRLTEDEKPRRLLAILDSLHFNQVVIFVSTQQRTRKLCEVLEQEQFPVTSIHGGMRQDERIKRYTEFKENKKRVLVSTDLFGRGMDIEHVNIVINFDMTRDTDSYLHRVARAGRFDTKGLAITFISSDEDASLLNETQKRFDVGIDALPDTIDKSEYMED
eukprot:m.11440 g.11440  ORF g.11440 m.11440 type:complete len:434 (-) comp6921_c0_seq1:564-1865(-)